MRKHNTSRRQSGFTLVELLITVAIIAILSIIGATVYASFTSKAQASEAMRLVEGVKHAYEVQYAENGKRPPVTLADLGMSSTNPDDFGGRYVDGISNSGGQIIVFFKAAPAVDAPLAGTTLVMTPYETAAGVLQWRCGYAPVPQVGGVDLAVAGTAAGAAITGLANTGAPESLLPKACRSS